MNYNPVGWFEIPVEDLDRAEAFYKKMLGVSFDRQPEQDGMTMSWFPMEMNVMGAAGSLVKSDWYKVSTEPSVVVYFTAPNLDESIAAAEENGGSVVIPRKSIGEHGNIAWVKDSEGNTIGLHSQN